MSMENLYLDSDEPVLLTAQNLVVDGIRHEAVLTGRRLILLRSDDQKAPHREIPLEAISSAIAGENALREPTITLVVTGPDGVLQTVCLVFIRAVSGRKNPQFEEWVNRLKERTRVTVQGPARPDPTGGTAGSPGVGVPAQQDHQGMAPVPSYVFRPHTPVSRQEQAGIAKAAAVVIIIALVVVGALFAAPLLKTKAPEGPVPPGSQGSSPGPAAPAETPALSPSLSPLPAPAAEPQVLVPPSGVWVRIQYPGAFVGLIGTRGSMREVNATGDRFYQIPATGGIIEAEINKMDGSGNLLAVELYRDGSRVTRVNSTAPHARVYLNAVV